LDFSHSGIATIARNSSIKKAKGYSALTFLLNIFVLPYIGKNIYRSIVINPKSDVGKDAVYEFMFTLRMARSARGLSFQKSCPNMMPL
jgi:hypothetical protein